MIDRESPFFALTRRRDHEVSKKTDRDEDDVQWWTTGSKAEDTTRMIAYANLSKDVALCFRRCVCSRDSAFRASTDNPEESDFSEKLFRKTTADALRLRSGQVFDSDRRGDLRLT